MALDMGINLLEIDEKKFKVELISSLVKHGIVENNKGRRVFFQESPSFIRKKGLNFTSNIELFLKENLNFKSLQGAISTYGTFNWTATKIEKTFLVNIRLRECLNKDNQLGLDFESIMKETIEKVERKEDYVVFVGEMNYELNDFSLVKENGKIKLVSDNIYFGDGIDDDLFLAYKDVRILHIGKIDELMESFEEKVVFSVIDLFSINEWGGGNGEAYELLNTRDGVCMETGGEVLYDQSDEVEISTEIKIDEYHRLRIIDDLEVALNILGKSNEGYFKEQLFCFAFIFKYFLENNNSKLATIYG